MAKVADNNSKEIDTPREVSTDKNTKIINLQSRHMPIVYAVGAVLVLLLVYSLGAIAASRHDGVMKIDTKHIPEFGTRSGGEMYHRTGGGFGAGAGDSVNPENRLRGVVTSVNGNDFTVGGNGATINVTTSSSTQYQNGSAVKQNDTVIVSGTNNNGTITATNIVINP